MADYTKSEKRLTRIASEVGKKYGYTDVKVELAKFKIFKCQWSRGYKWARFRMSDYIIGAPEHVVRNIFEHMFSGYTTFSESGTVPYTDSTKRWIEKNRVKYTKLQTNEFGLEWNLR